MEIVVIAVVAGTSNGPLNTAITEAADWLFWPWHAGCQGHGIGADYLPSAEVTVAPGTAQGYYGLP